MSTSYSSIIGSRTAFTITLNSLANATYVAATAVDLHALIGSVSAPLEVVIEVEATPGTVTGNKELRVFCQVSMDGSNFTTGPTSGTTTTDEPNLKRLGSLALKSNSTLQRDTYPVLASLGFIPYAIKPVIFNDTGASLAGSGNAMYYTVIYGDGR